MKYARAKHQKGFTVMESIVAFTILSLSITAFSGIIVNSLRNFRNSQERYVGAKIAQEGIELAINKKDNHVQCVESNPDCPILAWQDNLLGNHQVEAARPSDLLPNAQFQPFDDEEVLCILDEPPRDRGKFGYCSGGDGEVFPARYTREVVIETINAQSARVKSIVRWGNEREIVLESLLFTR